MVNWTRGFVRQKIIIIVIAHNGDRNGRVSLTAGEMSAVKPQSRNQNVKKGDKLHGLQKQNEYGQIHVEYITYYYYM